MPAIRNELSKYCGMPRCLKALIALIALTPMSARMLRASETVDFTKQIQPILASRCLSCHGPDDAEGGLRLSDQESAFEETDSGVFAIVAGDPDDSEMILRITSDDEYERMPPEGDPLTKDEVDVLTRWIQQGASWKKHWAFEPLSNPNPPIVSDQLWQANPIDAFVLKQLRDNALEPSQPASRATLIRRAYYDLTGLPPTADQVQNFIDDPNPNAFSELVDQLLDSPHYGERWGRHWLDLVRYAETNSFERDGPKPNAWKYRDYVIRAFNQDKPYDQFIKEQIAGDELDEVTVDSLTATGYYRLGIWDDEPADPLQAKADEMDDIIMTTGQALMGLTVNCARCHDHKIDPIPQKDYYSMAALLGDVTTYGTRDEQVSNNQIDISPPKLRRAYQESDERISKLENAKREIEQIGIVKMPAPDQRATEGNERDRKRVLDAKLKDHLSDEQWGQYQSLDKSLGTARQQKRSLKPRQTVLGLGKVKRAPPQTFVLFRGNPHSPTDPVEPAYPTIFDEAVPTISSRQIESPILKRRASGRRRAFADWLTQPDHQLTSRVMVNRIWQFHFGRGLVRSSNNFGQLGTPPTHPELLDWLSRTFVRDRWSIKELHRRMMNSMTYQMASTNRQLGLAKDPDNNLFWRFNPRRLSAEEVRDSILAASGTLNLKMHGPSIYPKLSAEVLAGQSKPGKGWGNSSNDDRNRRSVYIHVKRSLLTPVLSEFDFPDPDLTCEARFATLGPGQALALMNGEFAGRKAGDLLAGIGGSNLSNDELCKRTIRSVLKREASQADRSDASDLVERLQTKHGLSRGEAMRLYCLSIMNWNEFLFVD